MTLRRRGWSAVVVATAVVASCFSALADGFYRPGLHQAYYSFSSNIEAPIYEDLSADAPFETHDRTPGFIGGTKANCNGFTNPWSGVKHNWGNYHAYGYQGQIYLEESKTYQVWGAFDDGSMLIINGTKVFTTGTTSAYNTSPKQCSYTATYSGWHDVQAYVWDWSGGRSTTLACVDALQWNTNGVSGSYGDDKVWSRFVCENDFAFLRTKVNETFVSSSDVSKDGSSFVASVVLSGAPAGATLAVLYDNIDKGDTAAAWTGRAELATVADGDDTLSVALPAAVADATFVKLVLSGTDEAGPFEQYLPTVNLSAAVSFAFSASVEATHDTATVTCRILSFGGNPSLSARVEVCADSLFETLAGAADIASISADGDGVGTAVVSGLTPRADYYARIRVSSSDETATEILQFTTQKAPSFWTVDEDTNTVTDGNWIFAITRNGTDITLGALTAASGSSDYLDFSKPVDSGYYTITGLNGFLNVADSRFAELTSVTLPDTILTIKDSFKNVPAVDYIRIPSSVTFIEDSFKNWSALKDFDFDSHNLVTFKSSFDLRGLPNNASYVKEWDFSSLEVIDGAVTYCNAVNGRVYLPKIKQIKDWSFEFCDYIYEIEIDSPELSFINGNAFYTSKNLTNTVVRSDALTTYSFGSYQAPFFCSTQILLDCPNFKTVNRTFKNCGNLEWLEITSSNQLALANNATADQFEKTKKLKTLILHGPKPTEELMGQLMAPLDDYALTIHASSLQDGWAAACTAPTDAEKAMENFPSARLIGVYRDPTTQKHAWVQLMRSKWDESDPFDIKLMFSVAGEPVGIGAPTPAYGNYTTYNEGDSIVCTAPDFLSEDETTIYRATGWELTNLDDASALPLTGSGSSATVSLDYNATLTWHWAPYKYRFNANMIGSETPEVTRSVEADADGYYQVGTEVVFRASASDAQFVRWQHSDGTVISEEPEITLTIGGDMDIVAVFARPWTYNPETHKLTNGILIFNVTHDDDKNLTVKTLDPASTPFTEVNLNLPINGGEYVITALENFLNGDNKTDGTNKDRDSYFKNLIRIDLPPTIRTAYNSVSNFSTIRTLNYDSHNLVSATGSSFSKIDGAHEWDLASLEVCHDSFSNFSSGQQVICGRIYMRNLREVRGWTFQFQDGITEIIIDSPNLGDDTLKDNAFYQVNVTNVLLRSPILTTIYRGQYTCPFNKTKIYTLDCPNFETLNRTFDGADQLQYLEIASKKSIKLADASVKNQFGTSKKLKEVWFHGPIPTADAMAQLVSPRDNYSLTIYASFNQDGWREAVDTPTDEERASAKRPEGRLLGIYRDAASGKNAWVIYRASKFHSPLTLSIR